MTAGAKSYQAALYLRLSHDDDGVGESMSIGTQRKMLRAYAGEHAFAIFDEYVDDGWSGTNFERPAWKRLLQDIEAKKVNLVITKDLSRLGRDYIMTGQYTEIYFPSKGVRYIAINDGYDSDSPFTDIAPFKNIINEMYARDTSKKIRSALQTKMLEGAFIGNFAPYGYWKDPENKNHLLIDPAVSPIIQDIFLEAATGLPPAEIACRLNARGISTPAEYRRTKLVSSGTDTKWTSSGVCKLLRNPVYLGHIAQGKTAKVSFKSQLIVQKPPSAWVIVPNAHEPIVSQEIFDATRRRRVSRRSGAQTGFTNLFSGIAICADCGRGMSTGSRRRDGSYRLVCGGYKLRGKSACTSHSIDYDALYQTVLHELQILTAASSEAWDELKDSLSNAQRPKPPTPDASKRALERREAELEEIIARLYEDHVCEKLSEERFQKMLARFETEQRELAARLTAFPTSSPPLPANVEEALASTLHEVTAPTRLTSAMLHQLIDKIEIGQAEEAAGCRLQPVKIFYRFAAPTAARH